MKKMIIDSKFAKIVHSKKYNMIFQKRKLQGRDFVPDGTLMRWGSDKKDDPQWCSYGPEIADIEISAGYCPNQCAYCYKVNGREQRVENMSLATYRDVLDALLDGGAPLTQVALGITGVKTNPDLIPIMRYTRQQGVFPNLTLTGADLEIDLAGQIAELCGGLAVSCHPGQKELCYDTVSLFSSLGVEQTNIHAVLSNESVGMINSLIMDRERDSRLAGLNAIVLLSVKPKGRAKGRFEPIDAVQYDQLVEFAIRSNKGIGFDSCGAGRFLNALEVGLANGIYTEQLVDQWRQATEPCESMCFSIYINVKGRVYPCSFCEGEEGFEPIDLAANGISRVWHSGQAQCFRDLLRRRNRQCPVFEV